MKALKIKIYQQSACYRKPYSYKVWETYPLPPYSTVKGFFHKILKAKDFIPMSISVQGESESIFTNFVRYTLYKSDGEITNRPQKITELFNIYLVIHVFSDDMVIEKLYETLNNLEEFPSLGRAEDLVRIDALRLECMNVIDAFIEPQTLKMPTYIPTDWITNYAEDEEETIPGIDYTLRYRYEIVKDARVWTQKAQVIYADKGINIDFGKVLVDEEGLVVFPWPLVKY